MGHASMLLYSVLHPVGVKSVNAEYETLGTLAVTLDDIRRFRQLDSKCPGLPRQQLSAVSTAARYLASEAFGDPSERSRSWLGALPARSIP